MLSDNNPFFLVCSTGDWIQFEIPAKCAPVFVAPQFMAAKWVVGMNEISFVYTATRFMQFRWCQDF